MPMFSVLYESNGETIRGFHAWAADEAEARALADAFHSRYPEHDPAAKFPDLIVRVERTVMPALPPNDVPPPAIEQPARSAPTVIAIDKDGGITFNGEPISMSELVPRLRAPERTDGQEK